MKDVFIAAASVAAVNAVLMYEFMSEVPTWMAMIWLIAQPFAIVWMMKD